MRRRFALALLLALSAPAASHAQAVFTDNFDSYTSNTILQVASQTASFTASSSGTTLVVSVVGSGTINLYDALNASGLGGNSFVFLVAQISGTPGGAGSYTLSQSETLGSQSMTTSRWTVGGGPSGGNNTATTSQDYSAPNSANVGQSGDTSWAERSIGAGFSRGSFSARLWFTGSPVWSNSTIGFNTFVSLNNPTVRFGNTGSPPAGSVNLAAYDETGTARGSVNVTAGAWHLVSLSFNSTAGSDGCLVLSVDGSVVVNYQGATASSGTPAVAVFGFASNTVGASPDAEAYVDNLTVTAGGACGGSPVILLQ